MSGLYNYNEVLIRAKYEKKSDDIYNETALKAFSKVFVDSLTRMLRDEFLARKKDVAYSLQDEEANLKCWEYVDSDEELSQEQIAELVLELRENILVLKKKKSIYDRCSIV